MRRALLIAALLCAATTAAAASSKLERAKKIVTDLEGQVAQLEALHAREGELSDLDALRVRYSNAEIQYLLGEYNNAAVLLYDLVESPRFATTGRLADAQYYLGESLFQQRNYLAARRYFRELLERRESKYAEEALKRFLQSSNKLGDQAGLEGYFRMAAEAFGGARRPELVYLEARWNLQRSDLALEPRLRRAEALFSELSTGPFARQARYHLGVIAVQRGDLPTATAHFEAVSAKDGVKGGEEVRQLANLSLGRVYYEQGRYAEAIDRYQEIDRDSSSYNEALYEIAWSYVKQEKFDQALRTTEILLLLAGDSPLAAEAQLLQGHLHLKLGAYTEAASSYRGVISSFTPVRDQIDTLLEQHDDPVAYFNALLSSNDEALDVTMMLPPTAVRWAATDGEVGNALRVISDLEGGQRAIAEARGLGERLLAYFDSGNVAAASGVIADGLARGEAAASWSLTAEDLLLAVEAEAVAGAADTAALDAVRAKRAQLEARFAKLPKTMEQMEKRKAQRKDRIASLELLHDKLGKQIQGVDAELVGVRKWLVDTEGKRNSDPEGEAAFSLEVGQAEAIAADLHAEHAKVERQLSIERSTLGGGDEIEEELRREYAQALAEERTILQRARHGEGDATLAQVDRLRAQLDRQKTRIANNRRQLAELGARQAEQMRAQVVAELKQLDSYEGETTGARTDARDVVGRIAYESFKKVGKRFYGLVLKADLGLVDVAWTRKRERSTAIQDLAEEKERDLKELDDEFRDVVKEEP